MKNVHCFFALLLFASVFLSCSDNDGLVEDETEFPQELSTVVSYEEALKEVNAMLDFFENQNNSSALKSSVKGRRIANHYTTKSGDAKLKSSSDDENEEGDDDYFVHVFNFENDEGFAIISGDTRTVPVLAFAESGNLNEGVEIDNPGLVMFLANLETKLEGLSPIDTPQPWIPNNPPSPPYTSYSPWVNNQVFGNIIAAEWGQHAPYNNYCPVISGENALAGCVPIAIAQIMYHYGYPDSFGPYILHWDRIKKHTNIHTGNDSLAHNDIARLVQQIGDYLNTSYGTDGSGTSTKYVAYMLDILGYSCGGYLYNYNFNNVKESVIDGRPVFVEGYAIKTITNYYIFGLKIGQSESYSRGHAWVIDAVLERKRTVSNYDNGVLINQSYQYEYLVHCNWGWDGQDNGYYYSEAFNTYPGPVTKGTSTTEEGTVYNYRFELKSNADIIK